MGIEVPIPTLKRKETSSWSFGIAFAHAYLLRDLSAEPQTPEDLERVALQRTARLSNLSDAIRDAFGDGESGWRDLGRHYESHIAGRFPARIDISDNQDPNERLFFLTLTHELVKAKLKPAKRFSFRKKTYDSAAGTVIEPSVWGSDAQTVRRVAHELLTYLPVEAMQRVQEQSRGIVATL